MNFGEMFIRATGIEEGPFSYQQKIAEVDKFPSLLEVPTGAGKTAAAILGWVWQNSPGVSPDVLGRHVIILLDI